MRPHTIHRSALPVLFVREESLRDPLADLTVGEVCIRKKGRPRHHVWNFMYLLLYYWVLGLAGTRVCIILACVSYFFLKVIGGKEVEREEKFRECFNDRAICMNEEGLVVKALRGHYQVCLHTPSGRNLLAPSCSIDEHA